MNSRIPCGSEVGRSLNPCNLLESICTFKCCLLAMDKGVNTIGYDQEHNDGGNVQVLAYIV